MGSSTRRSEFLSKAKEIPSPAYTPKYIEIGSDQPRSALTRVTVSMCKCGEEVHLLDLMLGGGMPCRSSFFGAKITGRFSAEGVRSRSLGCVVLLAFLRFGTPTQSRGSWSWQWRYGAVPGSDASTRCCILRPILFIGVKESSNY